MKLKLNEQGFAYVQDGKPVFVDDQGKDIAFDAVGTKETISRLNAEAKSHREAKEAAEAALKNFEGIADPAAALKALETLKNIDDKRLVDAGQVEQIKQQTAQAYEQRIQEKEKAHGETLNRITQERDTLQATLFNERIGGQFERSGFIKENLITPPDMVRAVFGNAFKVEGDKVVAYDHTGNKIFSRSRPGEIASFDEALEQLVDHYPNRDYILKGTGSSGGGSSGGGQGTRGKTINRAAFDSMDASARSEFFKNGGTLTD